MTTFRRNTCISIFLFSGLLLATIDCNTDSSDSDSDEVLNPSRQFVACNNALSECINGNGNYCLFGFKWGPDPLFSPAGFNSQGPESEGGTLTFSFQEKNGLINTHAQVDLPSESFATLPNCAKAEIRTALTMWSSVANIAFEEQPENSSSDVRFFVADIRQGGIGYPNYAEDPCTGFSGNVIIQTGVQFESCDDFRAFILHETGHMLGLGHVPSNNIMNPDFFEFEFRTLQSGDVEGIVELYGSN